MLKAKNTSTILENPDQPHIILTGWDNRNAQLTEEFIALNDYKINEFVVPSAGRSLTHKPLQIVAIGKYRDFDKNGKPDYLRGLRITLKCLDTAQTFTVTENDLKDGYDSITLEQWAADLARFSLGALKNQIKYNWK